MHQIWERIRRHYKQAMVMLNMSAKSFDKITVAILTITVFGIAAAAIVNLKSYMS